MGTEIAGGILGIIVIVFLVVLAILWIILPFAIFGIKSRMDTILQSTKDIGPQMTFSTHEVKKLAAGVATLTAEVRKTNQILMAVHNVKIEE